MSRAQIHEAAAQATIAELPEPLAPLPRPPPERISLRRSCSSLSDASTSSQSSTSSSSSWRSRTSSGFGFVPKPYASVAVRPPLVEPAPAPVRVGSPASLSSSASSETSDFAAAWSCQPERPAAASVPDAAQWRHWHQRAKVALSVEDIGPVGLWLDQQLSTLSCGDAPPAHVRHWVWHVPDMVATFRAQLPEAPCDLSCPLALARYYAVRAIELRGFGLPEVLRCGDIDGAYRLLMQVAEAGLAAQAGLAHACSELAQSPPLDAALLALLRRLSDSVASQSERAGRKHAALLSLLIDAWLHALSPNGAELPGERFAAAWAVLGTEAAAFGPRSPQAVVRRQSAYLCWQPGLLPHALDEATLAFSLLGRGPKEATTVLLQAAAIALASLAAHQARPRKWLQEAQAVANALVLSLADDGLESDEPAPPCLADRAASLAARALLTESFWLHPAAPDAEPPKQAKLANLLLPLLPPTGDFSALAQATTALLQLPWASHGSWQAHGAGAHDFAAGQADDEPSQATAIAQVLRSVAGDGREATTAHASLLTRLTATYQRFWPVDFAFQLSCGVADMLADGGLAMPPAWRQTLLESTHKRPTLLQTARGVQSVCGSDLVRQDREVCWRGEIRWLRRGWFGGLEEVDLLAALQRTFAVGAPPWTAPSTAGAASMEAARTAASAWREQLEDDVYHAAWQALLAHAGCTRGSSQQMAQRLACRDDAALWLAECGGEPAHRAYRRQADREIQAVVAAWQRVQAACALPSCQHDLPLQALQLLALSPVVRAVGCTLAWNHLGLLQAWIWAVSHSGMQLDERGARTQPSPLLNELSCLRSSERCLQLLSAEAVGQAACAPANAAPAQAG